MWRAWGGCGRWWSHISSPGPLLRPSTELLQPGMLSWEYNEQKQMPSHVEQATCSATRVRVAITIALPLWSSLWDTGKTYAWVYWSSQDCSELSSSVTLIEFLFLIIYIHTGNLFTVLSIMLYSFGLGGGRVSLCSPGWTEFGVQIGLKLMAASLPQAPGY